MTISKLTLLTGQSASTQTPTDRRQSLSGGVSALTPSAERTGQSAPARETHTVTYTQSLRQQSANTLTDENSDNKVLAEMFSDLMKKFRSENMIVRRRMASTGKDHPGALVLIITPALEALMQDVNNE